MDPITAIGLVASVAQIAEHAIKLVTALNNYCHEVKEAPARSKELRDEFATVSHVLNALKETLSIDSIALNVSLERSVQEFQNLLSELEPRISQERTKGLSKFKWPFNKAENEKFIHKIERYKATFSLALNISQM